MIGRVEDSFREASRTQRPATKEESLELVKELLHNEARELGIYLEGDQAEYLSKIAFLHIYGYAFLDLLIGDSEIEEISVIGIGKPVYVFLRNKGWRSVNACFDDEKTIADIVNKMSRKLGRHITIQNPRLDAMLPDGSRLHASLPPVSHGEITIRKFRERPFSPRELCENGTLSASALAFLSLVMQGDHSVVIAGNTASGKTTTLNALFSFVPANERVLITEETPEINIPHEHQLRLVANRDMGISLMDLVYDSLRMRPDRMIVGEIRNKDEARALFDVLLAGQARGSYATMHAQSVNEALGRLKSFGIGDMDAESIDCIAIQRRMLVYDPKAKRNAEVRRVVEIAEMGNGPKTLFSLDKPKGTKLLKESRLLSRIADSFGMDARDILRELSRREKILLKLDKEFAGFHAGVQKELYGI
ncbi:TPA: CpaF family protein [Candidatus Micrarchaeota archaeon]|nr:CpaF family protein [Candidatus Micrarchaeota archaeon]